MTKKVELKAGEHFAPSKLPKARRKKALKSPPGVFPNPVALKVKERAKPLSKPVRPVYTVESSIKGADWEMEGAFSTESNAREYAIALDHKYNRARYIRITV